MLILDLKQTPRNKPWEVTVITKEEVFTEDRFWPCFYVIVDDRYSEPALAKIYEIVKSCLARRSAQLEAHGLEVEKAVKIEEVPDMTPLFFDPDTYRYIRPIDNPKYRYYKVYRIRVPIPRVVAEAGQEILREKQREPVLRHVRVSEINIRYIVNVATKMPYILFFNTPPLYVGDVDLDSLEEAFSNTYMLSYDCEDVREGGKRYIVITWRIENLLCTEDLDKVELRPVVIELGSDGYVKNESEVDYVRSVFEDARLIVDFNGTEYDRKLLVEVGVLPEDYFYKVSAIDMYLYVQRNASALGVGETSKGLQDIAAALGPKAGFKEEWIRIKQRKNEYLRSLEATIRIYNPTDVKLNTALARIVIQNMAAQAAALKIPLTALVDLPSGLVYEYGEVKMMECFGYIPEARPVFEDPRLAAFFTAMKVFHYKYLIPFLNYWGEKLRKALAEGNLDLYYKLLKEAARDFTRYAKFAEIEKKKRKSDKSEREKLSFAEKYIPKPRVQPPVATDESWHMFYIDCTRRRSSLPTIAKLLSKANLEIESSDFAMTYPSYGIEEEISACAFDIVESCKVLGLDFDDPDLLYKLAANAEAAIFNVRKFIAPDYAFLLRAYMLRKTYKQLAKQYKKTDPHRAKIYDIIQEALKRFLNSYFGKGGKKTGVAHLGHPFVALKIFHGTEECLGCVFLDAYARGWVPVYGDTDSIFFITLRDLPKEEPTKILNETVKKLYGLQLDYKARLSKFLHYRPKSYVAVGEDLFVKGKILTDMKIVVPQPLRPRFLQALREGKIEPFLQELESLENPDELLPSRSVRFLDMFVMTVSSLKTKWRNIEAELHAAYEKLEEVEARLEDLTNDYESDVEESEESTSLEDLEEKKSLILELLRSRLRGMLVRGYIQAMYYEPAVGDYVRSVFKKVTATHPTILPRLAGMALRYGKREGRYRVIDYQHISVTDIADIRAILIPQQIDKLSGKIVLAADADGGIYRVTLNPDDCYLIVADRNEQEYTLLLRYDKVVPQSLLRKAKDPVEKIEIYREVYKCRYGIDIDEAYILKRVKLSLSILSKATIEEATRAVELALYVYLKSKGLDMMFDDFDKLEDRIASQIVQLTKTSERKHTIDEFLTLGEAV